MTPMIGSVFVGRFFTGFKDLIFSASCSVRMLTETLLTLMEVSMAEKIEARSGY